MNRHLTDWHVGHLGLDEFRQEVVFDENHGLVCTICDRGEYGQLVARLIAAAPELLREMKNVLPGLSYLVEISPISTHQKQEWKDWINRAHAIIAKAEEEIGEKAKELSGYIITERIVCSSSEHLLQLLEIGWSVVKSADLPVNCQSADFARSWICERPMMFPAAIAKAEGKTQ